MSFTTATVGLLIGGVLAAPLGAFMAKRVPARPLLLTRVPPAVRILGLESSCDETAAAISRASFGAGVPVAYVATGALLSDDDGGLDATETQVGLTAPGGIANGDVIRILATWLPEV